MEGKSNELLLKEGLADAICIHVFMKYATSCVVGNPIPIYQTPENSRKYCENRLKPWMLQKLPTDSPEEAKLKDRLASTMAAPGTKAGNSKK